MRRLPFPERALLTATACSAVILSVVFIPSTAWAESPNPAACKGLYHGDPPGSLTITSTPPSGTVLHPGDEVEVTATWDTADWPAPVLHKVLDCLLVDGEVDYGLSSQEKPTDNDGLYRYRFTVRSGGSGRICDRVRLSGRLVEDGPLVVQKSNTICFAVTSAGGTGATGGPADVTTPAAATPADGDEGTSAPLQPAGPANDAPADDAPAPAADPAPAPGPPVELSAVAQPMLPRTGSDTLPLARLGGLLVLLGGIALATRAALSRQEIPRHHPQAI